MFLSVSILLFSSTLLSNIAFAYKSVYECYIVCIYECCIFVT